MQSLDEFVRTPEADLWTAHLDVRPACSCAADDTSAYTADRRSAESAERQAPAEIVVAQNRNIGVARNIEHSLE